LFVKEFRGHRQYDRHPAIVRSFPDGPIRGVIGNARKILWRFELQANAFPPKRRLSTFARPAPRTVQPRPSERGCSRRSRLTVSSVLLHCLAHACSNAKNWCRLASEGYWTPTFSRKVPHRSPAEIFEYIPQNLANPILVRRTLRGLAAHDAGALSRFFRTATPNDIDDVNERRIGMAAAV